MTNNNINNASKGTKRSPLSFSSFYWHTVVSLLSPINTYLLSSESIGKSAPSLRGQAVPPLFYCATTTAAAGRQTGAKLCPLFLRPPQQHCERSPRTKPSPPTGGADLYPAIKSLDISPVSPAPHDWGRGGGPVVIPPSLKMPPLPRGLSRAMTWSRGFPWSRVSPSLSPLFQQPLLAHPFSSYSFEKSCKRSFFVWRDFGRM